MFKENFPNVGLLWPKSVQKVILLTYQFICLAYTIYLRGLARSKVWVLIQVKKLDYCYTYTKTIYLQTDLCCVLVWDCKKTCIFENACILDTDRIRNDDNFQKNCFRLTFHLYYLLFEGFPLIFDECKRRPVIICA